MAFDLIGDRERRSGICHSMRPRAEKDIGKIGVIQHHRIAEAGVLNQLNAYFLRPENRYDLLLGHSWPELTKPLRPHIKVARSILLLHLTELRLCHCNSVPRCVGSSAWSCIQHSPPMCFCLVWESARIS